MEVSPAPDARGVLCFQVGTAELSTSPSSNPSHLDIKVITSLPEEPVWIQNDLQRHRTEPWEVGQTWSIPFCLLLKPLPARKPW